MIARALTATRMGFREQRRPLLLLVLLLALPFLSKKRRRREPPYLSLRPHQLRAAPAISAA